MTRRRSPERVRRLKELGIFDPGTTYLRVGGFSKEPKHVPWDAPDSGDGDDEDDR